MIFSNALSKQILNTSRTVYDTVVQVIVGRDTKQTFQAHKGLLSHFSEYFSRAFGSPHWQEAQEGVVCLEDEAPETFQLFYNWIYTGKVRDDTTVTPQKYHIRDGRQRPVKLIVDGEKVPGISAYGRSVPLTFTQLYRLAVFADIRIIPALTDTITSLIAQKALTERFLDVESIQDLTESILHTNKVVSCIAWIIAVLVEFKDYEEHFMSFPSPIPQAVSLRQGKVMEVMLQLARCGKGVWGASFSILATCIQNAFKGPEHRLLPSKRTSNVQNHNEN